MKRPWFYALVAVISLSAGITLDEGLHGIRNRKTERRDRISRELFQQKLRCENEADEYARKSSDTNSSLIVDRVEFSAARSSCIASFTRITSGKRAEVWSYETVDVLSGESLFTGDCVENDPNSKTFCGNGRDMRLVEGRAKALQAALTER